MLSPGLEAELLTLEHTQIETLLQFQQPPLARGVRDFQHVRQLVGIDLIPLIREHCQLAQLRPLAIRIGDELDTILDRALPFGQRIGDVLFIQNGTTTTGSRTPDLIARCRR